MIEILWESIKMWNNAYILLGVYRTIIEPAQFRKRNRLRALAQDLNALNLVADTGRCSVTKLPKSI